MKYKRFKIVYKKHGNLYRWIVGGNSKEQAIKNCMSCSCVTFYEKDIVDVIELKED